MCPKVSFADFSLRRVFWLRNRQSAWPFWHILVFASTFLTTLSVLLSFLLSTFLSSCRGLSLLLFSVISVKIYFSDLWLILFKGAEGAATTEWERPPPPKACGARAVFTSLCKIRTWSAPKSRIAVRLAILPQTRYRRNSATRTIFTHFFAEEIAVC